jgi:hypothetical protein
MALLFQQAGRTVPDGQLTQTVYGLIRDQRFSDAIQILERELQVGGRTSSCVAAVQEPGHGVRPHPAANRRAAALLIL